MMNWRTLSTSTLRTWPRTSVSREEQGYRREARVMRAYQPMFMALRISEALMTTNERAATAPRR